MSPPTDEAPRAADAVRTLNGYLHEEVTLDELIEWAERLEAAKPQNAWLRQVALDLANPLLCREQATALVFEHLRTRAPVKRKTSG